MSERYPGGFISKNAPTVSTSGAQGVWTLEQQAAYQKAGQWPFGGPFNYIEDVFSTYLYTGNGSNRSITNGIDLAGKGGLVWTKCRNLLNTTPLSHYLNDTARGTSAGSISSNTTDAQVGAVYGVTAFNADGYSLNGDSGLNSGYNSSVLYASWTFRKQPKFFDVVTYSGDGTDNRAISHNLGSVPGCIIIKRTNDAYNWIVKHRSLANDKELYLNDSSPATGGSTVTSPTSTVFYVNNTQTQNNASGTYVAYLFAHDAGGFGLNGTDNVISCGSFTAGNTTTPTVVNLGFEPQWVLIKRTTGGDPYYVEWRIFDVMRGMPNPSGAVALYPNSSSAESSADAKIFPTATGFSVLFDGVNISGNNFIYIAIRRGPMKTPTTGTSVFAPIARTATAANATITSGFVTDTVISKSRAFTFVPAFYDRLRGALKYLQSSNTSAEATSTDSLTGFDSNTGYKVGADGTNGTINFDGGYANYALQRAPGFMDVVCYTGTGVDGLTINHNLNVVPEMIILKCRNNVGSFVVGTQFGASNFGFSILNLQNAGSTQTYGSYYGFYSKPTATSFALDGYGVVNTNGNTYVAYLFASCPGVSKVGSYNGTGATQTISCGFAARFVLIKRTDATGPWWVWDTSRGMVIGTDPRLALQSTAAELNNDWVYTNASGFQIVTTDDTVNASGGSYIYLAIA